MKIAGSYTTRQVWEKYYPNKPTIDEIYDMYLEGLQKGFVMDTILAGDLSLLTALKICWPKLGL